MPRIQSITNPGYRSSASARDRKPRFDNLPLVVVESIAESLIARGLLKSLASLNAACRWVHKKTIHLLWRTVIWDPIGKTQEEVDECWKRLMIDSQGAQYIQFLVDRGTFVPSTDKQLPDVIETASAYKAGTLKAYIARFHDIDNYHIESDDPKVLIHLLPNYHPLGDDYITLRHALYMIYEWATSGDIYYLFLVHTPNAQPRRDLPTSIDRYKSLPSLPLTLEAVYLIPASPDYFDVDRQQLTGITFDFLASISHKTNEAWNGYLGEFGSECIMSEEECEGYIDFTWQYRPESAIISAECTAAALKPFRGTSRPWIQLSYGIEMIFTEDNDEVHKILRTIQPLYMERAVTRLCPPAHGLGDVTVQDISRDLLAALKRVVPKGRKERRNVVEYFIKRFKRGKGHKVDGAVFGDSHDDNIDYYCEYAVDRFAKRRKPWL